LPRWGFPRGADPTRRAVQPAASDRGSRGTSLGFAFKLSEEAAKSRRRIRAPEEVAELLVAAREDDGVPVADNPPEQQREDV
jgi:hypothetical protein